MAKRTARRMVSFRLPSDELRNARGWDLRQDEEEAREEEGPHQDRGRNHEEDRPIPQKASRLSRSHSGTSGQVFVGGARGGIPAGGSGPPPPIARIRRRAPARRPRGPAPNWRR
jgi:hypothetical protein